MHLNFSCLNTSLVYLIAINTLQQLVHLTYDHYQTSILISWLHISHEFWFVHLFTKFIVTVVGFNAIFPLLLVEGGSDKTFTHKRFNILVS